MTPVLAETGSPASRKSSLSPSVKQQHVMDSADIPKVLTLHVTERRPYLPFASQVVARREIDSALKVFGVGGGADVGRI